MTKMDATPIYGKTPAFFLRNRLIDFKETWHEASMSEVLQRVYK